MRAEHRRKLAPARRDDAALEPLAKLLHDRQRREDLGELVVVGHTRGRFGVVLHEANDAVLADETIEAGRWRGRAESGIAERERLLLWVEVELTAEVLRGD